MSPSDTSRAGARFAADPACALCSGLGVRHVAMGLSTARVDCPCTLIGPANLVRVDSPAMPPGTYAMVPKGLADRVLGSYCRSTSELPPIEDTAVLDQYPDCQPRTPIDPVTTVRSPGLMRGNADLQPAAWNPPSWVTPIIGAVE